MDMEASMWSRLPFEILEQVLVFVPAPDLCRYRAVCKAWDRLITDPKFAARHNAASTPYIVMSSTPKLYYPAGERPLDRWCILDVRAKRWYTVGYNKLYRFEHGSDIMAMDRGLVCQFLETDPKAVIVLNPIASTARVLPVAPDQAMFLPFPKLSLVVDAASAAFKVVLINQIRNFDVYALRLLVRNDLLVQVYESGTNEWRSMRHPPWIDTEVGYIRRNIMFRGWLYVLFGYKNYQLWRYEAAADVWERLAVPLSNDFTSPDLVVSDQRLFLAAWSTTSAFRFKCFYRLFEVIGRPWETVGDFGRPWETVFEYSSTQMRVLFKDVEDVQWSSYGISMFGFGSCVLFMSNFSGNARTFDVTTRTWDCDWPRNPVVKLPNSTSSWVGGVMNLLLPSTRW